MHGAAGEHKEEDGGEGQGEADYKEDRAKDSEVVLGCEGVDSDADGHAGSAKGCDCHDLGVKTCGDEGYNVGLAESEDAQEDVIGGDMA